MKTVHLRTIPQSDPYLPIRGIVASHLPGAHYRLYLFGSRVQGQDTNRSDYDIGILADSVLPLSTMARIQEGLDKIPSFRESIWSTFSAGRSSIRQERPKDEPSSR